MMRAYLDRMMRPREVTFRFRKGVPDNMDGASEGVCGIIVTSDKLTQDEIDALRAYMATKPDLVDGQVIKLPRSRDRTPLKLW